MALIPRLRIGNYGNGTIGLKAAIAPNDVTVLADDNDVEKRSFNSEWAILLRIQLFGVATVGSAIAHGLGYVPFCEMRKWDPTSKIVYDDHMNWTTSGSDNFGATQPIFVVDSTNMTIQDPGVAAAGGSAMYVIYRHQAA